VTPFSYRLYAQGFRKVESSSYEVVLFFAGHGIFVDGVYGVLTLSIGLEFWFRLFSEKHVLDGGYIFT
jgi:hypothetical protein